jgi:hypothetical protein
MPWLKPAYINGGNEVFRWSNVNRQRRRIIQEDRKYLEARVRRFLKSYLSADPMQKHQYYEAVAGASAGCQPEFSISDLESDQMAEATAEAALQVVKRRQQAGKDSQDSLAAFITDAYATVAVAYHRAAGVYIDDKTMQQLGTAAVHLLTMETSHMMAHSKD